VYAGNRKRRIEQRLAPKNWEDQPRLMLKASNTHYEMAGRAGAVNCGGIGVMPLMVQRLGLVDDIDLHLELLKVPLPYHESDHVLNLACNLLAGGQRLEDIELRRQDEVFRNGLGAEPIPDRATAGDFTRRFSVADISVLQECIHRARVAVWKTQPDGFLKEAFIDVDGTIAQTYGECKQGMDISYKGIWRYAPLIVRLANTKKVLHLVNRPGNAASQSGSVESIDRAVELVGQVARSVTFRGDTDFTHAEQLARWDNAGRQFILGIYVHPKLVGLAETLENQASKPFERLPKCEILTEPRPKAFRYKEKVVVEREFENQKLVGEELAEIAYRPTKRSKEYRVIILRKTNSMQKGEQKWTPFFGPRNAEIKLGFQVLLGLCFVAA
jgi:hypothetical protein